MTLKEAIKELNAAILKASLHFDSLDPSDLPALLSAFKLLKESNDDLKDSAKILNEIFQKISYEIIPNSFESLGFDSVKHRGSNFIVGVRLNASIPEEMRPKGHAWLEENGFGAIILPTVNAKTLSGAMSSYIDEKGLNPPEDAVKIHRQKYTSIRKA